MAKTQEEHTVEHTEISTNTFSKITWKQEWQWGRFARQDLPAQSVHKLLLVSPLKLGYIVFLSRCLAEERIFIC